HRGAAQLGQPLERLLAAADRVTDRALGVELGELANVGAGNEAPGLARAQHEPFRRIQREALEQGLQLDQHVLGEGVDRLAGAVEREHDDAVLALLGLPVAEAQSVEPCNHGNGPIRCLGARYHPDDVRSASTRRLKRPSGAGMACGRRVAAPDATRCPRGTFLRSPMSQRPAARPGSQGVTARWPKSWTHNRDRTWTRSW